MSSLPMRLDFGWSCYLKFANYVTTGFCYEGGNVCMWSLEANSSAILTVHCQCTHISFWWRRLFKVPKASPPHTNTLVLNLGGEYLVRRPTVGIKHSSSLYTHIGFIERGCHDYPEELDDLIRDTARTGVVRCSVHPYILPPMFTLAKPYIQVFTSEWIQCKKLLCPH